MTPQFEYSIANQDDVRQFGKIAEQCFISPPGNIETYINRIGVENLRLIHRSEQVVGGLAMLSMGQWFGGQCVPMTGIAAVGIAPEYRGSGAAIALMQHTVKELHTKGVPISVLYPATQRLYRKAGYEQGGALCGWEIPTESIQVREQPLSVLPVPSDCQVFHDLYQQQARLINGHLDRNPAIWQQTTQPDEKEIYYAYLLGSTDQPEGYIIFSQQPAEDGSLLLVKDRVVLTAAAAKTFWCFLANHRSSIKKVRWRGAASDSLMLLLPEQTAKPRFADRWLLRVIDVGKALSKRGYPPEIEAELHLEVRDDLIAENNGKFMLSVANGRGEVARGGKGELKLDVRGLAPLYTGLFTPHQLQLAGQLDATETAISTATEIFAGLSPWMPDFF
ncbi:GNAT family N-acetyltransferase [Chroococcidiopsis sp. CCMEE 29]|uniref:GNAT family N-acetyltransferase n=1 Tax=Chroococcidiopsis sp. CCMEE 29 TaxID=155894 RepID=UPI00201FF24F|nr:GNAT family N-acetyltransferase [Chroococcidiopsis sp. CCMEE 29]